MTTLSQDLKDAIHSIESLVGEIELISYGLAPNPNGFCWETLDCSCVTFHNRVGRMDRLIHLLNESDTTTLKELYL